MLRALRAHYPALPSSFGSLGRPGDGSAGPFIENRDESEAVTTEIETPIDTLLNDLEDIRRQRREARRRRLYRSKLDPYRAVLAALANKGASLGELKSWLGQQGLSAARMTILRSLRRWKAAEQPIHFLNPAWQMPREKLPGEEGRAPKRQTKATHR